MGSRQDPLLVYQRPTTVGFVAIAFHMCKPGEHGPRGIDARDDFLPVNRGGAVAKGLIGSAKTNIIILHDRYLPHSYISHTMLHKRRYLKLQMPQFHGEKTC